jgi:outer membrane protein TolC
MIIVLAHLNCDGRAQSPTGTDSAGRGQSVLTLSRAAEIALTNNPATKRSRSGRKMAAAQLEQAESARMPSLQLAETFINSNNPVFVFGSLLEQGRFTAANFAIQSLNHPDPLNNFRTALLFNLPVFDQKQTGTRIAQARIAGQQADLEEERTLQEVRFQVIKAYYGVVLAQARDRVARETVASAEAEVKQISDRFDEGLIVRSDLLAAEVQLSDNKQEWIQTQSEVITAQAALSLAMGLPIDSKQAVREDLEDRVFQAPDQAEMMRIGLRERPDLQSSLLQVHSTEEGVRGSRGAYLPRVDIFGNYGVSGQGLASGSSDYTLGARVTLNVFDAGRKARIDEAEASRAEAQADQERLANQVRLEVVRAYQQFVSARERARVADLAIEQATEALRIVQDRYKEGLTTITEVLRAETALSRAKLRLLGARYEYYIGYANLLMASGSLTGVGAFG